MIGVSPTFVVIGENRTKKGVEETDGNNRSYDFGKAFLVFLDSPVQAVCPLQGGVEEGVIIEYPLYPFVASPPVEVGADILSIGDCRIYCLSFP